MTTTTATSPLRVSSAQEAIDLLYNHFIKNRHRPAFDRATRQCFAMPVDACYPRCAIGILTKTSVIRKQAHPNPSGTIYITNSEDASCALNKLANSKTFSSHLRIAHDEAASPYHAAWNPKSSERIFGQHTSFRSAFAASLRAICAHYNLEYPGDR